MSELKSGGLKFVFNHDELQKFLKEAETIDGADKHLLLEIDFDTTSGAIVPTIKASTLHVHADKSTTQVSMGLSGLPFPPGK